MGSGTVIPCTTDAGTWMASSMCYAEPADPQPPADDPVWVGHGGGGVVLACSFIHTAQPIMIWAATAPGAGASPRALADQAVEAMEFRAGQIATSPATGLDSMGYVGLSTWMWVADPDEHTVGPITRTASAGDVTVTATGTLDRIEWDMGDGTTVTCTGPGTAYTRSYSDNDSPDCGHTYEKSSAAQPDLAYTITATSYWTVDWAGGSQTGTIDLDFSQSAPIRISEIQTIIVPNGH